MALLLEIVKATSEVSRIKKNGGEILFQLGDSARNSIFQRITKGRRDYDLITEEVLC